jgi:hypothetical protein
MAGVQSMVRELLSVCVSALPIIDPPPTRVVRPSPSVRRRVDSSDDELVDIVVPLLYC